jgi:hypothetical protein
VSDFASHITSFVPDYSANEVESLGLFVPPDQSLNSAIQVDVVFIYSKEALITVNNIDASQWFTQKTAFLAEFAQQLDLMQWQLVEGFSQSSDSLPDNHKKAILVLVFANNPNNKVDISRFENPWLVLDGTSIKVHDKPPKEKSL